MGSCGHSTLRSLTRIKRETGSLSLAGASLGGDVGAAQEEQAGGGGQLVCRPTQRLCRGRREGKMASSEPWTLGRQEGAC